MPEIRLETMIDAPIERVFDLARSIDLHKLSTSGTKEVAIDGKTSGLIELGETVTWRAKHFGIHQNLTAKIFEFEPPNLFGDVMLKGAFNQMSHLHHFESVEGRTKMTDVFTFVSPLGVLGKLADRLFLKKYMTNFLRKKNLVLKDFAEGDKWKNILP